MNKHKTTTKLQTPGTIGGWFLVVFGTVLFASLMLLPFLLHTYASVGTVITGPDTVLHGCIHVPSVTSLSECPIGNTPQSSQVIGIIGIATFIVLGIITLRYAHRPLPYAALRKFVLTNIVVAIATIMIVSTSYILIRNSSQNNALRDNLTAMQQERYELGLRAYATCISSSQGSSAFRAAACTQANTLLGGSVMLQNASRAPEGTVPLGYGILPEYVIIISTVYVLAPLLNWYRLILSPNRIRGQKKEALFQ